ncbi:MAG: HAD hydrolase-like protein [Crocinitomicaceae bacterium]|nr:HAD hydrolase-like protein [Crocinitomicaceae bacterium]
MTTQGISLRHYATVVFDCDGVVLNSNKIKTKAFYQATLPYGRAAAEAMVEYHINNGGVSRYKKFEYFLEQIAKIDADRRQLDLKSLLDTYAGYVKNGLLDCEIAPGLAALRHETSNTKWLIVSGGDELELRDIFKKRGISEWFNGGIFGSPRTKEEILNTEINSGSLKFPAIFFGDSTYDYRAAKSANLDFVFVSGWSELENWTEWVSVNKIIHQSFI